MMKQLHTVLPAADLRRAREFYHNTLELDPDEVHDGSVVYHLDSGAAFEIYESSNAGTSQTTQMGWVTDDLPAEMARLREHGVVFEEYDVPGMKTENGIAQMEDGRAAWFRDSEGNFICVSEHA